MSAGDDGWDNLIRGLREGDGQSAADFYAEYGPLLQSLAERHLPAGLRRRVGPEDVVQSVCFTFLRRIRSGEFQLGDSASLWRLLSAITLSKVHKQARFHLRLKRGVNQEIPRTAGAGPENVSSMQPVAPGPGLDEAAAFADQLEQILASLDEEERQLVHLKLQGYTNEEAAHHLGCSERTARRILKRVQSRLARSFKEI
jgi:RNA polymerase sigma-70 factor, ECF subfamily